MFYHNTGVDEPLYKYDIKPRYEDVKFANCRHLPFSNGSLNCIMFDPPFLATKGKSLLEDRKNNIINKRFGVYPSEIKLHNFYKESMIEFYRFLKENGIFIFKCQDKISSGKQYLTHVFIINEAIELGFYPKDLLFVLLAKNRIFADWQLQNQKNTRKYHSCFIVFKKCDKKTIYT